MSSVDVLEAHELQWLARDVDRERCRAVATMAMLVHQVSVSGGYVVDGHRSVRAWCRAVLNCSNRDAFQLARLGSMLARFGSAAVLAGRGELGVSQMHALAAVVANPRVADHLDASEDFLVAQAQLLDFDDYAVVLARWEAAADPDGAHADHDQAHQRRRAHAGIIGNQFVLDATGGSVTGVQLVEILDAFAQTEWHADWEAGKDVHGEAMCKNLLERTDAQRRFDALVAIFLKAAGNDSNDTTAGVLVNVLVGHDTFQHHLAKAMGTEPGRLDLCDPLNRCETDTGVPVDPADMLAAAALGHVRRVVLDSAGVVTDVGRRQRLFTGPLRDAILLAERSCIWPGCDRPTRQCQGDHVIPWANAGPTNMSNGAPTCAHHNRWRTRGYHTWRDPNGHWHHTRPDGTELGWRAHTA